MMARRIMSRFRIKKTELRLAKEKITQLKADLAFAGKALEAAVRPDVHALLKRDFDKFCGHTAECACHKNSEFVYGIVPPYKCDCGYLRGWEEAKARAMATTLGNITYEPDTAKSIYMEIRRLRIEGE